MRWGRRWRRGMRRRRRRWWRCPGRRWRRRCGPGWRRSCCWRRRARRRRSLLRLLGFSVGTDFASALRHHQRRGLRMRWRAGELHCRKRGRGEQHETKVCHDGLDPRRFPGNNDDQQISVRPDCGGPQTRTSIYFRIRSVSACTCSSRIQTIVSDLLSHCPRRDIRWNWIEIGPGSGKSAIRRRSLAGAWVVPAVPAPAIPRECGPAVRPAAAARRAPAQAAAPPAADFPADPPAAVRSDGPASAAEFRAVRSASTSQPCGCCHGNQDGCRWPRPPPSSRR
jgi:hypothetical protein